MKSGILYIVSTPIGNLGDITLRGIKTLQEVDLIAAEDTRRARTLMAAHNIHKRVTSYHSYNLKKKTSVLIKALKDGETIALISDSGTPGISDPGSVLISECIKNKIEITAVPGPTALIAALALSGKPTNKFIFEGFLSNKKAKRRKRLEELKDEKRTIVIYESPHRIVKFMEDLIDILGDRDIVLAREMTKKFEETLRGKPSDILNHFQNTKPRGEFVVII